MTVKKDIDLYAKKDFKYARVKCWVLNGTDESHHLRSLLEYFKKTNREIFIILDKHIVVDHLKSKLARFDSRYK